MDEISKNGILSFFLSFFLGVILAACGGGSSSGDADATEEPDADGGDHGEARPDLLDGSDRSDLPELPDVEKGCRGTATPCGSLLTSESCAAQHGCLPEEGCNGLATPCIELAGSGCAGQEGCISESECTGMARSCSSYMSHSTCISQQGCVWYSSMERCSGTPRSCDLFDGSLSCISQDGCRWDEECTGIATSCMEYTSSDLCGLQQGCLWSFVACSGTATECEDMPPELCSGQAGCFYVNLCQDGVLDPNEECDDGNFTDGDGCDNDCTFSCHTDAQCDDGMPCSLDRCDPATHVCTQVPIAAGTTCREAAGVCDAAEACDGLNAACPDDGLKPSITVCRPSAGDCDADEYCTGTSPMCPADAFAPSSIECRPAAGECDAAEYCSGHAAQCPEDAFRPRGTACGPESECDHVYECNGDGACVLVEAAPLEPVLTAEGGHDHICAVAAPGRLTCWGNNYNGELGDGTRTDRPVPGDVVGLTSGVTQVTAGGAHTCALTGTGGVKCWGNNTCGRLGDMTTMRRLTPVDVYGLSSGVAHISIGMDHSCALLASGGLKCWGCNRYGSLGNGTTSEHFVPIDVAGLTSGVAFISAGSDFTCAALDSGEARCWGQNDDGQLGDGTTTDSPIPVVVAGLPPEIIQTACGFDHACALTAGGEVWCWGWNYDGQCGTGSFTFNELTPVTVAGLAAPASAVSAGCSHTCVLLSTGAMQCFGKNSSGELGNGTTEKNAVPVFVTGLTTNVTAMATGCGYTCAVTSDSELHCWGSNDDGQLGDGTTTDRLEPGFVICG